MKKGFIPKAKLLVDRVTSGFGLLKKKIVGTEENEEDINLHHVKPEYIKKLQAIKRGGTVSSVEFEKKFRVKV